MKFLGIKNAQAMTPNNTIIDLILITDEGELPFTYNVFDTEPASLFVKEQLGSVMIAPYTLPPLPSLTKLQTTKKEEIRQAWLNEINNVGMPVLGYSFNVDFNVEDTLIWQKSMQFVDPEATEVEVRAIDNTFHIIPKEVYESIPSQQEIYYAKMLQKKWTLQKQAEAAKDIDTLKNISW